MREIDAQIVERRGAEEAHAEMREPDTRLLRTATERIVAVVDRTDAHDAALQRFVEHSADLVFTAHAFTPFDVPRILSPRRVSSEQRIKSRDLAQVLVDIARRVAVLLAEEDTQRALELVGIHELLGTSPATLPRVVEVSVESMSRDEIANVLTNSLRKTHDALLGSRCAATLANGVLRSIFSFTAHKKAYFKGIFFFLACHSLLLHVVLCNKRV